MAEREEIKAIQAGISSTARDALKALPLILTTQLKNQAQLEQTKMTLDANKQNRLAQQDINMINK